MDFIARAGSLVDRGHRVVGILLVVIIMQFMWIQSERKEKAYLQATVHKQNASQSIYVVPNSQANVYKPADSKLLLSTFVDYITQSVLTYTPASYGKQYASIRPFLSSRLLEIADDYYYTEIEKAKNESLSSLFVADRSSIELSEFKEVKKRTRTGAKSYSIKVKGVRHYVVGGVVIETKPQDLILYLQETTASKTNPFGFIVTKWKLDSPKKK